MPSRQLRGELPAHGTRRSNDVGFLRIRHPHLAESVIGLYKTEVIRRKGPWRTLEAVEFATLTWVDWFNTRRLLRPLGDIPPAEFEAQYYAQAAVA